MRAGEGSIRQTARRLTTVGDFDAVAQTVQRHEQHRQAQLTSALEALAKESAGEWSALQRAKEQSRLRGQECAVTAEEVHFQHLVTEQSARCQRSETDLARYSAAEKERINATPPNIPWEALALRNQESRCILQGSFAAAAKSRRDAARAEHEQCRASFAERGGLLDRRVSRHANSLLLKEVTAVEKDQLSMTVLQLRHAAEQRRIIAQVRHVEEGMLAAQRHAQKKILKTGCTADVSRAMSAAAHRGSALERRVYGDAYRVPSLCDSYGALLQTPLPSTALPALQR